MITQGLESRTAWRRQATNNLKKFANLTALANTHDIVCAEIDMEKLEDNLKELMNMIPTKIKNIEEADDKRDLYYNRHGLPHANHKETLPTRIINIEALLNVIPQPTQEPKHTRCIDKIIRLTSEVNTNLPDVGAIELAAFKATVENIKKDI